MPLLFQFTRRTLAIWPKAVTLLLKQFRGRFGDYPKLARLDDGKEFYNVGVKTLLERHNVKCFSTNSNKKAVIVERFNKTLKGAPLSSQGAPYHLKGAPIISRGAPIISRGPGLSSSIRKRHLQMNRCPGRTREQLQRYKVPTILMRPKDVHKKNETQVWTTLFGHHFAENPLPKFRVDDTLRISKYKLEHLHKWVWG